MMCCSSSGTAQPRCLRAIGRHAKFGGQVNRRARKIGEIWAHGVRASIHEFISSDDVPSKGVG